MTRPIYGSKNATELLHYAEQIFNKMNENSELFPEPVPSLEDFGKTLEDYRSAYVEARFRDQRAVILKGQQGKKLREAIYRLSTYVDSIALGDPAIIVAAGYQPKQLTNNRIEYTPKGEGLRISYVGVGTGIIRLRMKPWKYARMYRFEYREKGTQEWEGVLHGRSDIELSNLNHLKEYEFRASYIGKNAELHFSDVLTALVV